MNHLSSRWLYPLLAACLFATSAADGGTAETDEILRVLPSNMAACIVVEDFAQHLDLIAANQTTKDIAQLPLVQKWAASPTYRAFEHVLAFLPIYFGVSNDLLARDILGKSVVLAFQPGSDKGSPVGLLALRAGNEETLTKVLDRVTSAQPGRKVTPLEHQGISFFERVEFEGRVDYLVRLGPVVVLSDKRSAIEQVIATSIKGGGLYDVAPFQDMRSAIGEGAFIQLLVDPRPFDEMLSSAAERLDGPARFFARTVVGIWRNLDAAALSLRLTDHIEFSAHSSINVKQMNDAERRWAQLLGEASDGWNNVPSDAILAVISRVNMRDTVDRFCELAQLVPELDALANAFDQLAVGFPSGKEVFNHLGPEVGAKARVNEKGNIEFTLDIEFDPTEKGSEGDLTLAERLEWTMLRPILVFYTVDLNSQFKDTARVETVTAAKRRWHVLQGSTRLPEWLQPCFSLAEDKLTFSSTPDLSSQASGGVSWMDSKEGIRFREALGVKEVPKAMISLARLAGFLGSHHREIADEIAHQASVNSDKADGNLDELASLLKLGDFAVLSTSTDGAVRRWTLSIFPTGKSE